MKKLILVIVVALLLIASDLPPALPSSFWGYVTGAPAGATVTTNYTGKTTTIAYGNFVLYLINVTNGVDGQAVIIFVNGAKCGQSVYHTGTNQHVDLSCPVRKVRPFIRKKG
jgi:hypothetical protein